MVSCPNLNSCEHIPFMTFHCHRRACRPFSVSLFICILGFLGPGRLTSNASIAYGSINNFDTVNDTSNLCHGFEIELDDIHSTDITYTYDYNHYGTPKITEDNTDPLHAKVYVRYEAVWTNTGWSAYTAIPLTNLPPTQGHAYTDPSKNFGGEHFGIGYRTQPSKVYYHWLLDDGNHTLILGPQVNVSTPAFVYSPPVPAGPPAQVAAVIPAPLLPLPPTSTFEFSDATWVKSVITTTHTNSSVDLRDLITPDPDNPNRKDWRNGEPAEVEVEWQLLQTDFMSSDYNPTNGIGGANGKLAGGNQNVTNSDDVVTRRYEFYAYTGPYDDPNGGTHEALAQAVAKDGIHGVGMVTNSNGDVFDLSTNEVVGKFLGAQMSAMAAAPPVALIDHLPDGEAGTQYPSRSIVIASDTNFTATLSGALPLGMLFDASAGWVYGTPSEDGMFTVEATVAATNNPSVTRRYSFWIAPAGGVLPPHSSVDTLALPENAGKTSGDGVYTNGTRATVLASPTPPFQFANWTEKGEVASTNASYTFTNVINQSLVANFVLPPNPQLQLGALDATSIILKWPTNYPGFTLQENPGLTPAGWINSTNLISVDGANYSGTMAMGFHPRFFRLKK